LDLRGEIRSELEFPFRQTIFVLLDHPGVELLEQWDRWNLLQPKKVIRKFPQRYAVRIERFVRAVVIGSELHLISSETKSGAALRADAALASGAVVCY
jgi:hypothetical protein